MRKLVLALAAFAVLAGCSTLQGAYDERAEQQCEEDNPGRDRINCR
ncbi:MAG TPA: hypothetical protein VM915_12820 [Verrucomicrobiae bacterium]|nr:hypothetical protein [Verrucomicrobiae bacterium]